MGFDLKKYETVKERKQRFYETNKDGRIVVSAEKVTENEAVFFVQIFKNRDDQKENLAWATGYAQEFKGIGSMANKNAWCENCEESAVGRALDNAGYANHNGPSLEEMQKVERAEREAEERAALDNAKKLATNYMEKKLAEAGGPPDVGSPPPYDRDEMDENDPENYQIPFGANMGKRLYSFTREEIVEMKKKSGDYLKKTQKPAQMYVETDKKLEAVLTTRLPF